MPDIRARLRAADRALVPELWPEIEARTPGSSLPPPWKGRATAGALAALVFALGGVLLVRTFSSGEPAATDRRSPSPGASTSPTSSPSTSPSVSPSPLEPKANGRIAFMRIAPSTVQEGQPIKAALFSVNPDGTGLKKLGPPIPVGRPAWSPDGEQIAFEAGDGIFVVQADGTGARRVTSCDPPACDGEGSPGWSPDGSRLAFWADRDGHEGLWLVGADGSGLELRSEGLSFGPPAWSPDGSLIAVAGHTVADTDEEGIFLISADTGAVLRQIRPQGLALPTFVSWSPDGQQLTFDAVGAGGSLDEAGVYVIRADGSDLRLLTSFSCPQLTNACEALQPAWSPDGRLVAFTRGGFELGGDGSTGDLFTIDVETGAISRVTGGPGLDCCSSWQPVD